MELIDLVGQSRETLEKVIRDRCSKYGCVNSVTIRIPEWTRLDATAIVEMTTTTEAEQLDATVGDSRAEVFLKDCGVGAGSTAL